MVDSQIKVGGIYRHYKGFEYRVTGLAIHSETLETMVIYDCLYENPTGKTWVRPLGMFMEKVSVKGSEVPRFICVDQPD